MDKISISIGLAIIILFKASNSIAGSLCNSDCLLSITFPAGGAIDAIEPVTITFGDNGLINTVGSVASYLAGNTLQINSGESITFEGGGSFVIGNAGNITFTDLRIATDGEVLLSAVGGLEQIQVLAGDKLTLSGGGNVEVSSSIRIEGTLEIGPESSLNIVGPGAPEGCEFSSSSGASLSAVLGSPITISNDSSCNDNYTLVEDSSLSLSGSILVVDTATNTSLGTLSLIDNGSINTIGPLTLIETEPEAKAGSIGIYFFLLFGVLWGYRAFRKNF